jgi:hypothetical protein
MREVSIRGGSVSDHLSTSFSILLISSKRFDALGRVRSEMIENRSSLLFSALESLLQLDVGSLQAIKDQNLENSHASISTYLEAHASAPIGTTNSTSDMDRAGKCSIGHLISGSHRHEAVLSYQRQDGGFHVRLFADFQFF